MKTIHVFEGPAGAGKSTVARELSDEYRIPLIKSTVPNASGLRDYGPNAARDSMSKDIASSFEAAKLLNLPGVSQVMIDRWVLSQFVYESLRSSPATTPNESVAHAAVRAIRTLRSMYEELWLRQTLTVPEPGYRPDIRVIFHIINPRLDVLNLRRHDSGKEYPFNQAQEIGHYEKVFVQLINYIRMKGVGYYDLNAQLYRASDPTGAIEKWVRLTA